MTHEAVTPLAAGLLALGLSTGAWAEGPVLEDFFREMLTPGPTPKTARFHAYYKDAFSVDKLTLAEDFPAFARSSGRNPQALIVIGPVGPLWTYHVLTFFVEGEEARLNVILMPHGRITGKSTGRLAKNELAELLEKLRSSPLLNPASPILRSVSKALQKRQERFLGLSALLPQIEGQDFRFDFLLADLAADPNRVHIANLMHAEETQLRDELLEVVNAQLRSLETTYEPAKIPED